MADPLAFSRILIGLHQSALNEDAIKQVAALARLLQVDLHGLFLQDPRLLRAASLPGVREFNVLGQVWAPVDVDNLSRAVGLEAERAKVLLGKAARSLNLVSSFEIAESEIDKAIASALQQSDILAVLEPRSQAERVSEPFSRLFRAAMGSSVAVLLVPRRVARMTGPVVAATASNDESCLAVARRIAEAAHAQVLVVDDFATAGPASGRAPLASRAAEQMIIMSRSEATEADGTSWIELMASRRVPVLLLPLGKQGSRR